jgi:hypothetical protein
MGCRKLTYYENPTEPLKVATGTAVDPLQSKYPSLTPYNFVGNSPILFVDPDGKRIRNSRKMVLSNKTLIKKLKAFDKAVARIAKKDINSFTFVISGGDRYKDSEGNIYSATNDKEIPKSAKKSQHLREEGATGVDLKFAEGISYEVIEAAAEEVGFRLDPSGTYDDHFHLDLKDSDEDMEYNSDDYIPTDADFAHKLTLSLKIDNFATKLDATLEKINQKLDRWEEKQEARRQRRAAREERRAARSTESSNSSGSNDDVIERD